MSGFTKMQKDAAADTLARVADVITKAAQVSLPDAPMLEFEEIQILRALATFGAEECARLIGVPFDGEAASAHDPLDAMEKLTYCADPF